MDCHARRACLLFTCLHRGGVLLPHTDAGSDSHSNLGLICDAASFFGVHGKRWSFYFACHSTNALPTHLFLVVSPFVIFNPLYPHFPFFRVFGFAAVTHFSSFSCDRLVGMEKKNMPAD